MHHFPDAICRQCSSRSPCTCTRSDLTGMLFANKSMNSYFTGELIWNYLKNCLLLIHNLFQIKVYYKIKVKGPYQYIFKSICNTFLSDLSKNLNTKCSKWAFRINGYLSFVVNFYSVFTIKISFLTQAIGSL